MANYLSKPAHYGSYTQPINLDLVSFVLKSKQQKYDYNLAKLESKISDELGSIDLARTQDKEYFLNRASEALGSVGNISQIDFSQSGVSRQLDNKINSVVDDRVLNDVISTSNYRTFQSNLQEKQQSGDGTYSVANAAFAMDKGGINAWLNGESDNLGSVNYNDYHDLQKEIDEIEDNLDRYVDVQKVPTTDGRGHYYIDKTQERLTEEKVKDIVRSKLSDKAKKQMQINSWADYGAGNWSYEQVSDKYKEHLGFSTENPNGVRVKQWDRRISEKELQLNKLTDPSSEKYINLKNEIDSDKESKEKLISSQNKFLNPQDTSEGGLEVAKDNMAFMMYENNLMDAIADRNAFNRITDIDREKTIQYEFDLASYKQQLKNESEGVAGLGSGVPFSVRDESLTEVNSFEGLQEDISSYSESFSKDVNTAMNSLDPKLKQNIENTYDEKSGLTKEEHYFKMLKEQNLDSLKPEVVSNLIKADRERRIIEGLKKDYSEAMSHSFELMESGDNVPGGIENLVDEIYSNKNILMTDFDGSVISVRDFFNNNGITKENYKEFNSEENKKIKNHFLKSYYANMVATLETPGLRRGIAEKLQSIGVRSFGNNEEENVKKIKELRDSEFKEADLYRQRLGVLSGGDKEATKLIDLIKEEGIHGKRIHWGLHFVDRSFTEDETLESFAELSKLEKNATKFLNDKYKGGRNIGVSFNSTSTEGLALLNEFANPDKNFGDLAKLKSGKEYSVNVIPSGADSVIIRALDKEDGDLVVKSGLVSKNELPKLILDKVDFSTEKRYNAYTPESLDSFSGVATYSDESNSRHVKNVATFITGKNEAAHLVTKDQSINQLALNYITLLGSDNEPTPLREGIDKAMEDGVLEYKVNKEDGEFFRQLGIKSNDGFIPLYSDNIFNPIPEQNLEFEYNMANYAPQIGVYGMLDNMMKLYIQDPNNPRKGIKKLIEYGIR